MNERILMSGGLRRMGGMILAWIVAVVALVTFAPGSEAQSANVAAFEAATMQYGSFARVVKYDTASNGKALRWNSTGTATRQISPVDPGGAIVVRARTTFEQGGNPTIYALLDGRRVGSFAVTNAGSFSSYRVEKGMSAGSHELAIRGAVPGSKNLIVDHVYVPGSASPPPPTDNECIGTLQAKIDAASAGGTVQADPCIYREQVRIDKPLTLVGVEGTEIRGSEVWSAWSTERGNWISAASVPNFYQEDASCAPGTKACAWMEQVFVDGTQQTQVAPSADPGAGEFKVDGSRRVVLGADPAGKKVEVTVRKHLITGTGAADGVTIRNVDGRHAATDWRCGAIQSREPSQGSGATFDSCRNGPGSNDGDNWNVYDSEISFVHGALLSLRGDGANIENNDLHHAGQLGVHNPGDGSTLANNRIHHNNTEKFCIMGRTCVGYSTDGDSTVTDTLVEAGGVKVAGGIGPIMVRDNVIHHNYGTGLWFDVGAHDATIVGNRIHNNGRRGIFFEISDRAVISSNTVYSNGWDTPEGLDGAGIEIGNSDDVEVSNNVLAWNADGIAVRCYNRNVGDESICERTQVLDNTILQQETHFVTNDTFPGLGLAWVGSGGSNSLFSASSGNIGTSNKYYYPSREDSTDSRFAWNDRYASLSGFNPTPGEEIGRYMSEADKNSILETHNLPASP